MPRVFEINVQAGRTFNNPYESYSNLRPGLTVRAEIHEGEDWEAVARELQVRAEVLMDERKRQMLAELDQRAGVRELAAAEDQGDCAGGES